MPIYLDLYGNPAIWQPFIVEMLASPDEMIECKDDVAIYLDLYGNPDIWQPCGNVSFCLAFELLNAGLPCL